MSSDTAVNGEYFLWSMWGSIDTFLLQQVNIEKEEQEKEKENDKEKKPTWELKLINCEGHTCTLDSKSCSISAITVCLVSFGKISAGQEARVTSTTLLHASKDSFLMCKLSRIMLRSTTLWRMSLTSCNKIKYTLSISSWGSPPFLSSYVYDTDTMSLFKDTWTSVPLNTFKKHTGLDTATNTNAFVNAQMILGHCKELTTVYSHTLT